MKIKLNQVISLVCIGMISTSAFSVPFTEIRIGDNDGFGYDADPGFASLTGDGGAADRNSDGHLGIGDVLPSLNGNNVVATGNRDDFDNRLGESINGTGFVDNGTWGEHYTDIALSTSYDTSSSNNQVYNANTGTYGAGGAFPAPPSQSVPNQPGFAFDFFVADSDISAGTDIYFNMVFGDYDVTPADIDFTFAGGISSVAVSPQNNGPDDGLIQGAFTSLSFSDVFTWNAGLSGWDGFVGVDFSAPREPYTAFDYVELSVDPLVVDVSEPSSALLFITGLAGLVISRRRVSSAK